MHVSPSSSISRRFAATFPSVLRRMMFGPSDAEIDTDAVVNPGPRAPPESEPSGEPSDDSTDVIPGVCCSLPEMSGALIRSACEPPLRRPPLSGATPASPV